MARQHIKQLKSKDPEERKKAIRTVAKAADRNALKQLAIMAGDDPDPKLRKLAQQAGVYIRQKIGEIPTDKSDNGKPEKYVIEERDLKQAQRLMQVATTANMQGENARAIMLLAKARDLNPNLLNDGYFISLAEQTTGMEGQAAVQALGEEGVVEKKEAAEADKRRQKEIDAHHKELETRTWRDVFFNIGIASAIAFIGTLLVGFIAVQTAQNFYSGYEQNREDVAFAIQQGNVYVVEGEQVTDGDSPVYLVAGQEVALGERPDTFTDQRFTFNPTTPYWDVNAYWRDRELTDILLWAGFALVMTPFSVLLMASVTHDVASWALRGDGKRAYYTEAVAALFINRILLLAALCFVVSLLYFGSGNSATMFIGAIGLYGATVLFTLIGRAAKAYRFSTVQAGIAVIIGAAVAGGTGVAAALFVL